MRYPAAKVMEALLHPDPDVRAAAVYYFSNADMPDPAVMPLVIQAIEKYGYANAFKSYDFMPYLEHSDESVRWLIRQLQMLRPSADDTDDDPLPACREALAHTDGRLLKAHESEIKALPTLDRETREAVNDQIRYVSCSGEDLWGDFEIFCSTFARDDSYSDADLACGYRLAAALGRFRDRYGPKVLAILRGEANPISTLKDAFTIRLAGEMRLEEAMPELLAALMNSDDEWIEAECEWALMRMGDAAIACLTDAYPRCDEFERSVIACVLEDIHTDRSVQACFDFLKREKDPEIKGLLLDTILSNCASEGIEPARQFILRERRTPDVLRLRSTLLTACKLMGETFLEFNAWIKDSKNDAAFRKQWRQAHPEEFDEDDEDDDECDDANDDEKDYDDVEDDDEEANDDEDDGDDYKPSYRPPQPIVRHDQRIGRNDPCPCGSGKKFKKCCYRK